MKRRTQRGFTLIELMSVVAIIGILAAIALPACEDYTIRARITEGPAIGSDAKNLVTQNSMTPVELANVGMGDGGHAAASLWRQLSASHLAPPERRISAFRPLPMATLRGNVDVETPALIRGYLRCGAELLGPPAHDADFNTADLPMLMSLDGLPRRHRRHFLGAEVDQGRCLELPAAAKPQQCPVLS